MFVWLAVFDAFIGVVFSVLKARLFEIVEVRNGARLDTSTFSRKEERSVFFLGREGCQREVGAP